MKTRRLAWQTALIALFTVSTVGGEEGGWKVPNLNPFAAKPAKSAKPPTSGWKIPSLMPKSTAKRRSNQPSTYSKVTQGTQKFFSKTADALNPFDDKPAEQPKITGSNSIFTQQRKSSEAKTSESGISPASWFSSENKGSKPKSVNDFLSQPRP